MPKFSDAAAARKMLHDKLDELLNRAEETAKDPHKFKDVDKLVRDEVLSLGEGVVRFGIEAAAPTLRLRARETPCPHCKKPLQFKQFRRTTIRTSLTGEPLPVLSPVADCANGCAVLLNLVRHGLGLDDDGRTIRLRELAAMAGTIEPFEAAASQVLSELAGITMSANGVHGICQDVAEVARERMNAGRLGQARTLKREEVLYVMADGCMVWVGDGWHEAKFAVIFPSGANPLVSKDRHMTTERQVICTLGDREDLGDAVWNAVERWLPRDVDGNAVTTGKIVFISDGSVWLRNMCEEKLPGAFVLLDWYHMAEHVAETAKILHAGNDLAAHRWRKEQEALLMNGRVSAMLNGLELLTRNATLTKAACEAVTALHGFLEPRRASLRYCEAKARGYLIGSGSAESAANHVVQQRMKRAGMRWERDGATAMLALRAAWRSTKGFVGLVRAA